MGLVGRYGKWKVGVGWGNKHGGNKYMSAFITSSNVGVSFASGEKKFSLNFLKQDQFSQGNSEFYLG
jgi:hypothetical protein